MSQNPQSPPPVPGLRAYLGGSALMLLGFGAWTWLNGRDIPWGYQQTGGSIAFGVGLLLFVVCLLWRRNVNRVPPTS